MRQPAGGAAIAAATIAGGSRYVAWIRPLVPAGAGGGTAPIVPRGRAHSASSSSSASSTSIGEAPTPRPPHAQRHVGYHSVGLRSVGASRAAQNGQVVSAPATASAGIAAEASAGCGTAGGRDRER